MESSTTAKSNDKTSLFDIDTDLNRAHQYIYSIDFTMIINKLIIKKKWLRVEAEEACEQYRNFLYLAKKYGISQKIVPTVAIDEFLHHHLLDTRKYICDCAHIFGEYRHHEPSYEFASPKILRSLKQDFSRTRRLYRLEFNEELATTKYYLRPLLRLLKY